MIAAALASSPPPLPGFLNALSGTLQHYGLWAIGLLITLEDFGVPVPGETILIAGAIYAGAGRLNIVALGVVAFVAAVTGDNIGFAIGHFGGRALALRFGRYVFLTEERLDKAERFFDRRGSYRHYVRALRRGSAPGERDYRRHHRHALAALRRLQRHRRGAVGGDLGHPRLLRRKQHHHRLPLHHAVLVLRARRAGGADRGVHRLAAAPAAPRGRGRGQRDG